jgi:hypothetical protein
VIDDRTANWSFNGNGVASISTSGAFQLSATVQSGNCPTGQGSCTATIVATIGGVQGTAALTVRKQVASVDVSPANATINENGSTTLTATPRAADNTALTDRVAARRHLVDTLREALLADTGLAEHERTQLADCDPRGRLLEGRKLAGLDRGLAARAGARLDHHRDATDEEWDPDADADLRARGQPDAIDERAVRAAVVLDLDVVGDQQIRVVARHRPGVDRDITFLRAADGQGSCTRQRHDLKRRAVDHEQHTVSEWSLPIDLFGRCA